MRKIRVYIIILKGGKVKGRQTSFNRYCTVTENPDYSNDRIRPVLAKKDPTGILRAQGS